jgi:hypothetical protein
MTSQRPFGLLILFLILVPQANAQGSANSETPMDRLRREISLLEKKQCDSAPQSSIIRDELGKLLESRREKLALLLEEQLAELKAAPVEAGIALTPDDQKLIGQLSVPLVAELALMRSGHTICDSPAERSPNVAEVTTPLQGHAHLSTVAARSDATVSSFIPSPTANANKVVETPAAGESCALTKTIGGVCGGAMLRTIVGFEQAGVSAAKSKQDFFFDLLYDRPLAFGVDPDLGPALRSWGNLRISSVPQQITTDVATFAATFAQQVGQLKVNQAAQAFEFLGGVQYRLFASHGAYASTDPQNDAQTHTRVSASAILGGGVVTPLSPQDSVQIFDVPSNQPNFFTQFPQAVGKQFVAFTLPDRNRFFREAYGGFRIMTHFLGDTSRTRFPETFDLTYGFNEAITGGRIRGGVMRLEGFVPIPYSKASWIYLFGTGMFKPGARATISNPFLLAAAPTGTLPTDPNAVVITTPQADRDYYRVGIGIDFVTLIADWKNK